MGEEPRKLMGHSELVERTHLQCNMWMEKAKHAKMIVSQGRENLQKIKERRRPMGFQIKLEMTVQSELCDCHCIKSS